MNPFNFLDAEGEEGAVLFDEAGDLDGFGDEGEDLFIEGFAVSGGEEEAGGLAILIPDDEDGGNAAADATDGAGAVGDELAGVHDAEVAFAVDDFAGEGLAAEIDFWGAGDWSFGKFLDGGFEDFDHALVVAVDKCALEGDGFVVEAFGKLGIEAMFEGFDEVVGVCLGDEVRVWAGDECAGELFDVAPFEDAVGDGLLEEGEGDGEEESGGRQGENGPAGEFGERGGGGGLPTDVKVVIH
jgi:hypothetical protein